MRILIARIAGVPARVAMAVDLAAASLRQAGHDVADFDVPSRGLPPGLDDEPRRLGALFTLTPGALIESWRVARHLEAASEAGDTVVVTDHRGLGGVFALEQTSRGRGEAVHVWTLAGESIALHHLDTLGTLGGYAGETESAIDWELVQYRSSAATITPAARVVELLECFDVEAALMPVDGSARSSDDSGTDPTIWLPEPVSRTAKTPTVMRALEPLLSEGTVQRIVVSSLDADDEIWTGTTWDHLEPIAGRNPGRVVRDLADPGRGSIILGDPFAVPVPAVAGAYAAGRAVLVPRGSTAAALLPAAIPWRGEDEIAAVLRRGERLDGDPAPTRAWPTPNRSTRNDRARAVSVGIPVHRDVRYLDECVRSILDQTQKPHEVILYDDGSGARAVDDALSSLQTRHPDLVRTMEGPNRGVCVARNEMLEAMTGDAFLLVDSDDLLQPEFIEATADALRADHRLTAVATWTEFFGGYAGVEAKPPFDVRVGLRENPIISTAVLVDMAVRDDGIRFAPDLAFLYCEDWNLWSQIIAAGGTLGLVPRALARHRVHAASGATKRTALAHTVGRARATEPIRPGELP